MNNDMNNNMNNSNNKRIAFHNLGCKVNAYESELMQQNFINNGYELVAFDEIADIYIINTCTVTNIADRKSRQMLHRAKALNPEAVVVAVGCYAESNPEGAAEDEAIDLVVLNREKRDIVTILGNYLKEREGIECFMDTEYTLNTLSEHTRAYIKIQDGCNQFCSYCIIPYSRGRITSRDKEETLKEIRQLVKKGCREFVLTGIHLSSYGLDINNESGLQRNYNDVAKEGSYTNIALISLMEEIGRIPGVERIRLGSLEPRIITDELLLRCRKLKQFCPHFHLSLQSGSDTVLKRMNRRYDTKEYKEKVELIRKYFEHPAITTDVIVGFPGETIQEFEETRKYLEAIDFYEVHIFKYSRRRGTVADKMPGQLTDKEKGERSRLLSEDSKRRALNYRRYYLNKEVEVLMEEALDGEYYVGYNKEYVRFAYKSTEDVAGKIITGIAREMKDEEIIIMS